MDGVEDRGRGGMRGSHVTYGVARYRVTLDLIFLFASASLPPSASLVHPSLGLLLLLHFVFFGLTSRSLTNEQSGKRKVTAPCLTDRPFHNDSFLSAVKSIFFLFVFPPHNFFEVINFKKRKQRMKLNQHDNLWLFFTFVNTHVSMCLQTCVLGKFGKDVDRKVVFLVLVLIVFFFKFHCYHSWSWIPNQNNEHNEFKHSSYGFHKSSHKYYNIWGPLDAYQS